MGRSRFSIDRSTTQNDAALKGASELCPPFQEDPILRSNITGRELDPQIADMSEVLQDLGRGVVRKLGEECFVTPIGALELAEGFQQGGEHELEEIGDEAPRLRRQVQGIIRVAVGSDDAVDLDIDVVDEWDEGIEALGDGGAAAERPDIGELVKDDENYGIRNPVKLVLEKKRVCVYSGFRLHFG